MRRLTYVVSCNDTIHELNDADDDEEAHECIEEQRSWRRVVDVLLPDVQDDVAGW